MFNWGIEGWLPERLALYSFWNRTVNMARGPGRIIEADIVNEFPKKEFIGLKKVLFLKKLNLSISSFVDMYNFLHIRLRWVGCRRQHYWWDRGQTQSNGGELWENAGQNSSKSCWRTTERIHYLWKKIFSDDLKQFIKLLYQ